MQTGAAADRLGLGQGLDVPFAREGRRRGTASTRESSDDEKVRGHVAAVVVYFHLLAQEKTDLEVCESHVGKMHCSVFVGVFTSFTSL